jgi:hypothetical protein
MLMMRVGTLAVKVCWPAVLEENTIIDRSHRMPKPNELRYRNQAAQSAGIGVDLSNHSILATSASNQLQ